MSGTTDISDEDRALFREAVGEVLPIKTNMAEPHSARPAAVPNNTRADNEAVMRELIDSDWDTAELEMGDELYFLRTGIQKRTMHRLRRGLFPIEAELDLHGMTVETARPALAAFLHQCGQRRRRCARIIHGKGLGSRNKKPVLKNKLNHWLQQWDEVLAFCSARPVDGGTGAIYLLLKNRR